MSNSLDLPNLTYHPSNPVGPLSPSPNLVGPVDPFVHIPIIFLPLRFSRFGPTPKNLLVFNPKIVSFCFQGFQR